MSPPPDPTLAAAYNTTVLVGVIATAYTAWRFLGEVSPT